MPTTHLDLPLVHAGKVRELYATDRDDQLLLVATDTISAFDQVLPTPIPDKGALLTQLSTWWLGELNEVVPNHLVSSEVPSSVAGRAVVVERLEMVPVECVVRGYLAGSAWREYRETGSVAGVELPRQLLQGERLERPLFTPARKAPQGEHDETITYAQLAHSVGPDLARQLWLASMKLYVRAERIARTRGLILVDTKFEFGRRADGTLVLADEVLTPDSSRYWAVADYRPGQEMPALDKQLLRDWLATESGWDPDSGQPAPELPPTLVAALRDRYADTFRRLTGYDVTPAAPWVGQPAEHQTASSAASTGASAGSGQAAEDPAAADGESTASQSHPASTQPGEAETAQGEVVHPGAMLDSADGEPFAPTETVPAEPGPAETEPVLEPADASQHVQPDPAGPAVAGEIRLLTGGAEIEQAHVDAGEAADLLDTRRTVGLTGAAVTASPDAESAPAPTLAGEPTGPGQPVLSQVEQADQAGGQTEPAVDASDQAVGSADRLEVPAGDPQDPSRVPAEAVLDPGVGADEVVPAGPVGYEGAEDLVEPQALGAPQEPDLGDGDPAEVGLDPVVGADEPGPEAQPMSSGGSASESLGTDPLAVPSDLDGRAGEDVSGSTEAADDSPGEASADLDAGAAVPAGGGAAEVVPEEATTSGSAGTVSDQPEPLPAEADPGQPIDGPLAVGASVLAVGALAQAATETGPDAAPAAEADPSDISSAKAEATDAEQLVGPDALEEPAGETTEAVADLEAGTDLGYQAASEPADAEAGWVTHETGPVEPAVGYDHRATQEAGVAHETSGPTTTLVVEVMPKPEILDPQGKAVTGALRRLGFAGLSVRQGKRFEVVADAELTDDLVEQVRQAAQTLLANTVIEDFTVVVPEEQGQA